MQVEGLLCLPVKTQEHGGDICSFVFGGTHCEISGQTVRNPLHGGLTSSSTVPCSSTGIHQRTPGSRAGFCCPDLFTDESKFTLSTCDKCEAVSRGCGKSFGGSAIDWLWDAASNEILIVSAIRCRDEILPSRMMKEHSASVHPAPHFCHDTTLYYHGGFKTVTSEMITQSYQTLLSYIIFIHICCWK